MMDYDKLLNIAIELGNQLMSSGAEIYRTEESIFRLLRAYGLEDPQVFAIPNTLIVSVTTPQGHPITRMSRIPPHGTDLEHLERCNDLCRRLCFNPLPLEDAHGLVKALRSEVRRYRGWQILMGHALAAGCFCPLFGGNLPDMVCAAICGYVLGLFVMYGSRFIGYNGFFRTVISSAIASVLPVFFVRIGIGQDVDLVTIGVLMLLVPGAALTNSMREIMAGDILSGLSRLAEVLLTASAIALGAALGPWVGRFL